MPLGPGAKLGPYEVLAPLGAGGMGEVYRAKDTRLDRTVALKVLPGHLAGDPDLRQRFEREARAVSSLNHPHICALYDVGHQDGTDYLVMEYIEGETLADRLRRGPLPTDQVLRYGIEIAGALDKAHRQGIVHRDLKPGNVMLTKSGVKLLDFGLAKLQRTPSAPANSWLSDMATADRPLTEAGTVLGTFQYMAPEQLEGKEADARTDLFALGTILYEMATGRKAFSGKNQASLIAAILSADPPALSSIQPLAPPALERLVKVSLAKDPDERLQTAHDVMQELKWIAEAGSAAGVPAPVAARRRNRERLAWTLAAGLPLLAAAGGFLAAERQRPTVQPTRFVMSAPEGVSSFEYHLLSPDGRNLAFPATAGGVTSLWMRPLDSLEAQPLPGTEGVVEFTWSWDSRFVAFVVKGRLQRLALSGGPVLTICSMKGLSLGGWSRQGTILLSSSSDGSIYQVSAAGGTPVVVTTVATGSGETHVFPSFLPDGRHFVFLARRTPVDKSALYLGSLDSPERRLLVSAESQAFYAEPGYLLFVRGTTLMAQPFDTRALRAHGEPILLAYDVMVPATGSWAYFSVSRSGGTLAFRNGAAARTHLTWLDRTGQTLGTVGATGSYLAPDLSPDGTRLLVVRQGSTPDEGQILLFHLDRGASMHPLNLDPGPYVNPLWSRDAKHVLFWSGKGTGPGELHRKAADGASSEVLLKAESAVFPDDVSPDGRTLLTAEPRPTTGMDIGQLPLDRPGAPRTEGIRTRVNGGQGRFAPDGRWLAYIAFYEGHPEVYVGPYPPTGVRRQVSISGGSQPRWRADGKELFYLALDGTLMSVDTVLGPEFKGGQPRPLFKTAVDPIDSVRSHYVVAADGKRFLFVNPVGDDGAGSLTVVLNWATERQP